MSEILSIVAARIFGVLLSNRDRVEARLVALAKRAQRKALPIPSWSWGGISSKDETHAVRADVPGGYIEQTFYGVKRIALTLNADPIRYNGWTFLAALAHLGADGTIVKAVPGEECPTHYRERGPVCDHCKVNRRRNDTFVLRHEDGRTIQVGSTCVADFLGGYDAEKAAHAATLLADLRAACEDDSGSDFGSTGNYEDLADFLPKIAASIRADGWVSRTAARDRGGVATADVVWHGKSKAVVTDEDRSKADAALEWARSIDDATLAKERGDYLYNVRTLALAGYCDRRSAGLAGSIVAAYDRAQTRATVDAARRSLVAGVPPYLGTKGKRESFGTLTLAFQTSYEGGFGTTFVYKFTDAYGRTLVWKASSGQGLTVGNRYTVIGTVKDHADYKGTPQTVLTRCKVEAVEAAA